MPDTIANWHGEAVEAGIGDRIKTWLIDFFLGIEKALSGLLETMPLTKCIVLIMDCQGIYFVYQIQDVSEMQTVISN